MQTILEQDRDRIEEILRRALEEAGRFLAGVESMPAGGLPPESRAALDLPGEGWGALRALECFQLRYTPFLSGSAGPRYFGFVTGGTTPAALAGDWLVSAYDQNALGSDESIAPQIELETLALLRQLFGLPDDFGGTFVSGATMANFVGLALGRQWVGREQGLDFARQGLWGAEPLRVLSATPHSSIYKALAMLGMGRDALVCPASLPGREAVDVVALEGLLQAQAGRACIVVANAGTVNTVDFDDLAAIAELRGRYPFWLHVDAAFGGFAACSPLYHELVRGLELADSLTIDAHKWLNVPYDAAMQFTRRQDLQAEVFQNSAAYLGQTVSSSSFVHLTPENSRRLRAMPSWFTLLAYGRQGYAEIVERCCQLAGWLGEQIASSADFELLAPVRLNGVCFSLAAEIRSPAALQKYQKALQRSGAVFLTPTIYQGIPALRASITNWRTAPADLELAWAAMRELAGEVRVDEPRPGSESRQI